LLIPLLPLLLSGRAGVFCIFFFFSVAIQRENVKF
jgi:hypothetical protein